MPTIKQGETKNDFVSRCIPIVLNDGTAQDNNQAVAVCNSMYEQQKKDMQKNDEKEKMKLETVDLDNIEIFEVGKWKGIRFDERDLDEAINNYKNKVLEPYINLDHNPGLTKTTKDFFKVMSLGFVSNLWRKGKKLMANFKQVPKLIGELIQSGALKQRSVEWWLKYKHANGKVYKNVLEFVTYHGANGVPALSTLADIPKIFKDYENEYKKESIEQSNDDEKIVIEFKETEEKPMSKIEVEKNEYDGLLKLKSDYVSLQNENNELKEKVEETEKKVEETEKEVEEVKKENEELTEKVEEAEKAKEEDIKTEAKNFVEKLIEDKKILPKFKDDKIEEYIEKYSDPEKLEKFKDFHNNLGDVINFGEITKDGEGKEVEFKHEDFKPGDETEMHKNAHEAIQAQIKKKGYKGADAYTKAMADLNLIPGGTD